MRLIGNLQSEGDAKRLCSYLKRKGIDNTCDVSFEPGAQQMHYRIWVHDEDRFQEAQQIFDFFVEGPSNATFDTPITEQIEEVEKAPPPPPKKTPLTQLILILCTFLFFLNLTQEYGLLREDIPESLFEITPIQGALLFDLPAPIEKIDALIQKNLPASSEKWEAIPKEIEQELNELAKTPFFRGGYDWLLLKAKKEDPNTAQGPLFGKISEGEVWRLITPAFLHRDLLHILFNMLWVWVLCRPIEQRIGSWKTVLLSLFCGVVSNVFQYLMGGPFFIGYSGIVLGLAGFTWVREKIAPWEGYPMHRSTLYFLLFFVLGMFALQCIAFALQVWTSYSFEPNIANTAHIVGALSGALLGRLSFFSMRMSP